MIPVIMHLDMNSYFASCEQQDNEAWRGKPIGVCEHLGGIIIAPSIEAKRWGIKTGTPVWEARKLYPKIILTPTNPDRYRYYTARFLKVLADYSDDIEKYSIDEAFVDLTKVCNITHLGKQADPFEEALAIAKEIKARFPGEVGDWLKCSIGIGWNKLVAKVASDFKKPNGLTVFRPKMKPWLYEHLQLTDIPGIGHRMKRNLNELGIRTLSDLRDYPADHLISQFGIAGFHLHHMGQLEGTWKENFDDDEPIKSMGHMYTVPIEFRQQPILEPVLYKLSEMVAARLRINELHGDVLRVHVHTPSDDCFGQSKRLGTYLIDGREIFIQARAMLRSLGCRNDDVYLVGVTLADLRPIVNQQPLFPKDAKHNRLLPALDAINEKYDDFTVARVPAFLARDVIRDSIGFGRMKEFSRSPVFLKGSQVKGSHGRFK